MKLSLTPEQQAAQLRKPSGEDSIAIAAYMAELNMELYNAVFEKLPLQAKMRVLELGPGEAPLAGRILRAAADIHYTGLDYSPEMIKMAQAKWPHLDGFSIHEGQFSNMPFADDTFDLVFGINVVYFWDNPESELREIKRVMKSGAKLVLGYRPKNKMQVIPFTRFGFNLYDADDLEILLSENGFTQIEHTVFRENPRFVGGKAVPMDSCVTTGTLP
jgi:SAM-dependent methyltransferase